MKIILLKSWWFNIGDGFVKIGAKKLLHNAFPDAEIIEVSLMGANKYTLNQNYSRAANFPSLLDYLSEDIDLVVMAGCVLNEKLDKLINKLTPKKRKFKILFLGAGARNYNENSVAKVSGQLRLIKPDYLIARDEKAFKYFKSLFVNAKLGIDCGYFVSDAHPINRVIPDLKIATFNRSLTPRICGPEFVSMNHIPLRLHGESKIRAFFRTTVNLVRKDLMTGAENFISDSIEEYLFFYANASEVHTDMVHATVASISYNTPVKFYAHNHRTGVICDVFGKQIYDELFVDSANILSPRKTEMIESLRSLVNSNVSK